MARPFTSPLSTLVATFFSDYFFNLQKIIFSCWSSLYNPPTLCGRPLKKKKFRLPRLKTQTFTDCIMYLSFSQASFVTIDSSPLPGVARTPVVLAPLSNFILVKIQNWNKMLNDKTFIRILRHSLKKKEFLAQRETFLSWEVCGPLLLQKTKLVHVKYNYYKKKSFLHKGRPSYLGKYADRYCSKKTKLVHDNYYSFSIIKNFRQYTNFQWAHRAIIIIIGTGGRVPAGLRAAVTTAAPIKYQK